MQLSYTRVRTLLLAGGLVVVSMSSRAVGQQSTYSVASPQSQQQQINMLQQEIQSLRAEMNSMQGETTESLPPVGIGFGEVSPDFYVQDKDGKDSKDAKKEKKSIDSRVADLEKAAKKASDSEKKKKAADAEKPSIKVRGRIQTDMVGFDQEPASVALNGDIQDGVDFRRARIGVEGTILEVTNYRIEMDFAASGRPSFTDVYLGVSELPYINNIRAGHYKEWYSLEELTSSNYITFMERSLPVQAFSPARNWGISTFDHFEGECGTWALGAFRPGTDDFGDDIGDAGEWAVTSRLTAAPYYDEPSEGRYVVHLGGSASHRDPDSPNPLLGNGTVTFATPPEIRMMETGVGSVPNFASTGALLVNDYQIYGAEAALVWGALSIQGEMMAANADPTLAGDDLFFDGAYLYASYFLTGEHRNYNRKNRLLRSPDRIRAVLLRLHSGRDLQGKRRLGTCSTLVLR